MDGRPIIVRWDELPLEKVSEMVSRKVLAGAGLVVSQVYFKKGTLVPVHAKPTEQVVYVLQGALRVTIAGEEQAVREGESIVIAAGSARQAESLDDTFMLVVSSNF
jgi:quercetin dioxygenase-like cupin family protein